MKLNQKSGAKIAMTAAALVFSGALATTAMAESKGKCIGANSCKGTGACKTAQHDCAGKNACKGKGWVKMTESDCKAAGGKFQKS